MASIASIVFVVFALLTALAACGGDDSTNGATPTVDGGSEGGGGDDASSGVASCTDGKKNGTETDVDCGGSCAKCTDGKACSSGTDCSSGVCTGGTCETPPGAPKITSFTAAKALVTTGTSTTLTAVFSGGTGSIDHGVGAVTSGTGISSGNVTAKTTFTLTVTSPTGQTATQTVTVDVAAAPAITSFTSDKATVTTGTAAMLTAVFAGGTGTVDQSVGAVTTGVAQSTGNLTANTTFTLTVTNAAGDTATAMATVNVVAAPTITSFTAADVSVSRGTASSVTGVFAGGTGVVDNGVGTVTSGVAAATQNLTTKTTFTLTVTNAAGDFVTATVDIGVHGELFITTYGSDSLVVVDDDASGTAVPKRTIQGSNTTFSSPRGVSVVNDEIYVANDSGNGILVFNVTDDGNVAPKRAIVGGTTTLADPTSLFVTGGEIFVGNRGGTSILVFNTTDNGDVPPKRGIAGNNTTLASPNGVAVDGSSLYVVMEGGGIAVFPTSGTGNIAPTTSFPTIPGAGLLLHNGEAFVSSPESTSRLAVYDEATGTKLREISGGNTTFGYWTEECTLVGTDILCANFNSSNGQILAFPLTGDGNIAPSRSLTGSALGSTIGVFDY